MAVKKVIVFNLNNHIHQTLTVGMQLDWGEQL